MNIKSLLIGSAALATVSTGAFAADAIVLDDPEPMEYVRVCDVYGVGFFYIPGTETCIKIGGYYRYDMIGVVSQNVVNGGGGFAPLANHYFVDNQVGPFVPGPNPTGWSKLARFAPSFDVRTDSEIGTVRGFAEMEIDFRSGLRAPTNANGNSFNLAQAFIQLQRPSGHNWLFGRTTNPYFGVLGGLTSGAISSGAGSFGFAQSNQVQWSYARQGSPVTAALALVSANPSSLTALANAAGPNASNWIPDIEAALRYGSTWGFVGAAARYSSLNNSYAARLAAGINFGNTGLSWNSHLQYGSAEVGNNQGLWGGAGTAISALTVGTGFNWTHSPAARTYLFGIGTFFSNSTANAAETTYSLALGAVFTAAPRFTINPEVSYNFGQFANAGGQTIDRNNLNVGIRLNYALP